MFTTHFQLLTSNQYTPLYKLSTQITDYTKKHNKNIQHVLEIWQVASLIYLMEPNRKKTTENQT